MKRTKTLLLSCLITMLVGLGLFFWLLPSKQAAKPVTIGKDSDSVVFVQPKAVVNDTAKDINVIRDYYRLYLKRANGQDISVHDERRFLTQTLIDKLCYRDGMTYLPLFPLEDNNDPRWSLDDLKIRSVGEGWYSIQLYDHKRKRDCNLAFRMVTDKYGQRKIGFAYQYGQATEFSDADIYKKLVKMDEHPKDEIAFLKAFIRSYLSLNLTIDLDAPAYRKYLCDKFVKAGAGVYKSEYSGNYLIDWLDGPNIDYLSSSPVYSIVADKEGEGYFIVPEGAAPYEGYYVEVGKRDGHYYIMQYGTTDPYKEPSDDIEPVTIEG